MADKEYELPTVVAVALQTQRGELLRALGPQHSDQLVKGMSQDTCEQLLNLIADLIDDRYKLKVEAHEHDARIRRLDQRLEELQESMVRLKRAIRCDSEEGDG